jgi:hypothetical protein
MKKNILYSLICACSLFSLSNTMQLIVPAAKSIAIQTIAETLLQSKYVEQELVATLNAKSQLGQQKKAYRYRYEHALYKLSKNTLKTTLITIAEYYDIAEHFNRVWQESQTERLSSTDLQRAIGYVAILRPLIKGLIELCKYVVQIIKQEQQEDAQHRILLKRNPIASKQFALDINHAVSEILTLATHTQDINRFAEILLKLNKTHFAPCKFGRKFYKAVQALNGLCIGPNGQIITQIDKFQAQKIVLEFLKELAITQEDYINYLQQAEQCGLTLARTYIRQEQEKSCFEPGTEKRLSPKWLTKWERIHQSEVLAHEKEILDNLKTKNEDHALVAASANGIYVVPAGAVRKDLALLFADATQPCAYTLPEIRADYMEPRDSVWVTAKPSSRPTKDPIFVERPITSSLGFDFEKAKKQATEYIKLLSDKQVISEYNTRPSIREHEDFLIKVGQVIGRLNPGTLESFSKDLTNQDFVRFYDQVNYKLNASGNFKHIESRITKLAANKQAYEQLHPLMQSYVQEKAQAIQQVNQLVNQANNLLKLQPSLARNHQLLALAKQCIGNLNLRLKLLEHAPRFDREIATIMRNKVSHAAPNTEQALLALAFESQEIASSNLLFLRMTQTDIAAQFNQLQQRARELCKQYNINFDLTSRIAQRFNIAPSNIINNNKYADSLQTNLELIQTLENLSQIKIQDRNFDLHFVSAVQNISTIAQNAIASGNHQRAAQAIDTLSKTGNFFLGMAKEAAKVGGHAAVGATAGVAIHTTLTALGINVAAWITKLSSAPVSLGMMLYNVYSNNKEIQRLFHDMLDSYSKGDFNALGKIVIQAAGLACDAKHTFNALKNFAHAAFKSGNIKAFVEQIKHGAEKAQQIAQHKAEAQIRHQKFKTTDTHTKLSKQAIELGMSEQAWERRVANVCAATETHEEVTQVLTDLHEFAVLYQGKYKPDDWHKPILFDFDHIFVPLLTGNSISGYHATTLCKASKLIKLHHIETAPNGLSRAIVECGGAMKEKTIFPAQWSKYETMENIMDAIKTIKFSQQKIEAHGKMIIQTKIKEIDLQLIFNPKESKILSIYGTYEPWKPGDLAKRMSRSNT